MMTKNDATIVGGSCVPSVFTSIVGSRSVCVILVLLMTATTSSIALTISGTSSRLLQRPASLTANTCRIGHQPIDRSNIMNGNNYIMKTSLMRRNSELFMVSSSVTGETTEAASFPDESLNKEEVVNVVMESDTTTAATAASDTTLSMASSSVVENPDSPAETTAPADVEPIVTTTTSAVATTTTTSSTASASSNIKKKKKMIQELRAEGGPFTFNTPVGALNPFAIYYGIVSIVLGLPWFVACKFCQLLYWVTRGKFDPKRRVPVFLSHVWGTLLMRLTRNYPTMKNLDILQSFYKEDRPAMFVANHCSWMDIPFLGATIGWRNYKLISKSELGAVPILGTAIRAGGNIMVDRSDRKSQLKTLKQGIQYLKDGIHLCTFPEGTRSRTGRLLNFKNGAFKMAYKAGAPVIPISIVNSHKVMPTGWMMAMRPARGLAEVIVHEPIESEGKTEEELATAVRVSMLSGLPADQVPLD